MGRARAALGYEYLAICDHTRNVRVVPGPRRRRRPPPGRGDRGRERAARAVPDAPRDRVRHPPGRLARPPRRRARGARLGADQPPRGPALARASALTDARARGDAASGCLVPLAPEGADPQPPARERARPRAGLRGRARDGRRGRGERPPRPARPLGEATCARRSPPGVKIVCSTDAHSARGLGNMPLSVTTARRGGARRRTCSTRCRWPSCRSARRPCRAFAHVLVRPRTSASTRSASATCGSVCGA